MHAQTLILLLASISPSLTLPTIKDKRQVCLPWHSPIGCVKARDIPSLLEGAADTALDATDDAVNVAESVSYHKRQLLDAVGDLVGAGNDVVNAGVRAEDSLDGVTGNEKREAEAEAQACGPYSPPGCLKKREAEAEPQACGPFSPPGCLKKEKREPEPEPEPQACTPLSPPGCMKNARRQLGGALGDVVGAVDDTVDAGVEAEDSLDGETGNEKREAEPEAQACFPWSPPGCLKKAKREAEPQICPPGSPPGCMKNARRQLGDAVGDAVDAAGSVVDTAGGLS